QPQPNSRLDYAEATHDSKYGEIVSGWKIDNGNLTVSCTIPANTTATIVLPEAEISQVMENDRPIAKVYPGVKETDGNVVIDVGSGSYSFTYPTSLAVRVEKDSP
ncbi:MAG: alpha-L-rhamnosidase C-terminal domain-containing protein, partial [Cyclobacteriaceae bacterium]